MGGGCKGREENEMQGSQSLMLVGGRGSQGPEQGQGRRSLGLRASPRGQRLWGGGSGTGP